MSLDEATQAERDFFASRGRNTEALLAENKDGVQRVADETPAQEAPAAGADTKSRPDDLEQLGGPVHDPGRQQSQPTDVGAQPTETKSVPAPLEEEETRLEQQTKRVSWNKYQAERDRAENERKSREALEAKEREWIAERAAVNERLRLFNEALKDDPPQQVEEDPAPDPMQDAYAYMQWQTRELQRQRQALDNFQQQQGAQTEEQRVVQAYRDDALRYQMRDPLFTVRYQYLRWHRDQEYQDAYPNWTPEQRAQAINQEEYLRVRELFGQNRSPAEYIHRNANLRGFDHWYAQEQAKQQNDQSATPVAGNGAANNGAPAIAAPLNPQTPSAVQQVQAIAQNQAASRSLSNAGGGTPLQNIDARMLANMPQEEFEAYYNRLQGSRNKAALRDLMGH